MSGKGYIGENHSAETVTVTTHYTYDILQAYANVLTETVNGDTTAYEYGLERIAAYTGTDAEQVKTQYVYDVRGSVIQTITGKVSEHIAEETETPTATLPSFTVQSYSYRPFGEQIGEKFSGYGYNGEYFDAATGMLNLRARQYEPAMMRFCQKDIVRGYTRNPISLNRYAYCENNPLMNIDPSGKSIASAVTGAWNKIKQTTIGKAIDKAIVQPVKKTVNAIVSSVKNIVKEQNKKKDAELIRKLARDRGVSEEEFRRACGAIAEKYEDVRDFADIIVYVNEMGGLPQGRAMVLNEVAEKHNVESVGLLRNYEDLSTEKPNQTWFEQFLDFLFPTAYAPGLSYVKVIPDEAFYPVEINGVIDWAKYNIILPIETMAEEDWQAYWAANAARYEAYCKEGGLYNTLDYWMCGIPDAAKAIYRAIGENGQTAWNDPTPYNIANYLTLGLIKQFDTAINTPTTDPNYWRALRNILTTEAGAIALYNGMVAGATLPTTTEDLIRWGDRYGAPSGVVPAGSFPDEAFESIQKTGDDIISLYRAVSPEEFQSIMESAKFSVIPESYEGKQFGLSLDETLAFADKVPDAAAIIEVEIPQEILDKLADMTPVDTTIFKHGTVTINIDNLTEFNNAIKALRQVE